MGVTAKSYSEDLIQNSDTMRYRPLGSTGLMVSALSMGCMRLVEDQEVNTAVVSKAIDLGVNYFETTRWYCGGQCQHRTAPGLKDKTEGVIVSGKAGINENTTQYGFRKEIETQLDILGLSHFKFFQVGWFGWGRIGHLLKRGGVLDAIRQAQDEGLIHHIGFTGHDSPENFTKLVETGLFDSITVPYNLINRMYEPTIARAGELGIGVVAMCPVSGGLLGGDSPMMREALGVDMPTAEVALRFVLSNPDVSTACSGMNTVEMLEENVEAAKRFDPEADNMFDEVCDAVSRLWEKMNGKVCTKCGYCMPCPQGVQIPRQMDLYQMWQTFGLESSIKAQLDSIGGEQSFTNCTACGACEAKCPNGLPISDSLKKLEELVG